MSEELEKLKAILSKKLPEAEVQTFMAEFTLASGQGAVAISGDAAEAIIITGNQNIVGDNNSFVINQGTDPEELIPMLRSLWREMQPTTSTPEISPEELRSATLTFLQDIASKFKETRLFHTRQPIILQDQYVPIQVTLELHRRDVETLRGYWETEEELKRAYALKGGEEELKRQQMDWEEAKQKHQQLMVLADPGMGKSTLLRMEGGTTAEQEWQRLECGSTAMDATVLPLFLRLSELAKDAEELIVAIPKLILRDYPRTAPVILPLLTEKLKTGKCLLLLDALDEVPRGERLELKNKLDRFVNNYSCPVICTSRIVGYDGNFLVDGKEVEIVPFRKPQIEQYVTTWFTNAAGHLSDQSVSAAELMRELGSKPQVRGLVQNPLLLSLICSLYQERGLTLPARRAQVYKKAVEYMLVKWSKEKREPRKGEEDWADLKQDLLENLAYQFSCEDTEVFSRRDLRRKIDQYLKDESVPSDFRQITASDLLVELAEQDGILQKLNHDDDQYLFLHRTFQEYLTACYLARSKDGIALAKTHFWEPDWHEAINLMAGLMKKPLPLLQAIMDEPDDIPKTQLLLAGRCLTECEEILHPLIPEIIDRIYQTWSNHSNTDRIISVVVAIGQTNSQILTRLQETANTNAEKHISAIRVLGEIGTAQAVDTLINHPSLGTFQYNTWFMVIGILELVDNPQAVDSLISALDHKNPEVVRAVAMALARIGSPQAMNALSSALACQDSDKNHQAKWALEQKTNGSFQKRNSNFRNYSFL